MAKIYLDDIVYHPTFNCNLSCRGCVNYSNHLETRTIPDESNWDRDLDILFERFQVRHIEIAGGETLMFPHLVPLIKKLSSSPVKKYTILTNGILLHKNMWLKEIFDIDPKMQIRVSVHGHPMLESVYIKNLTSSVGEFLDINPDKFKKYLRRQFLSKDFNAPTMSYGNGRIIIDNHHKKDNWAYPRLDRDELPILFNNNQEDAYKRCISPAPHIKDGKIYKCPMMAMLPKVLTAKNIHDSKWNYLRDYIPYDLLSLHSEADWQRIPVAEDVCAKCPYDRSEWDRNKTDLHSKIVFGESVLK